MTPVLDFDRKTSAYIFPPDGKELVFRDEKELILYLAHHTETSGREDPSRWQNDLIPRQFSVGRPARTWTVKRLITIRGGNGRVIGRYSAEKTENWDYWFHDAAGRTLDVRMYLPQVMKAVRGGLREEEPPIPNHPSSGRKSHRSGRRERRHPSGHARAGAYLRQYLMSRDPGEGEDGLSFLRTPRGKLRENARLMSDFDYYDDRAAHSTGWKEHKYRHQWEHRVRDQEKRLKALARKAHRRK